MRRDDTTGPDIESSRLNPTFVVTKGVPTKNASHLDLEIGGEASFHGYNSFMFLPTNTP